ncbi:hypothetical protein EDB89DRAFT_2229824 [Lactarius sanguifluus]|nr:hypothetical protein EDB89DRAFT_2229824 [Lactarius sanguifluus]
MYYDDEDDDPYAPRIGPAAMPSPRSKFAPYYSGHADTFEDFLEEYEGLAYDCALTDLQRVDVIIRYVNPSLRDFWRSLSGHHSHDWPQLRQSLINIFGNPTPRHQIMKQKLHSHVQDSSRKRMDCEDDVLQYYRQFLCYSAPLVHAGNLSKEERDAAFWYGFHPLDREVLWPRLLGKNPFQPSDVPFYFEDVFVCARGAFAYGNPFPPWLYEQQFQSPSVRREQLVIEPILRDAYSFRAVTCAISSNAETTGNLDELPSPPQSTPQPQFPSSSPSASEPQQTKAPSVTLDQPEPAHTFSSTLLPSASPRSHTLSLVHSATDNDLMPAPTFSIPLSTFLPSASEDQLEPEPAPTFPITTSMLLPSVSPTPSHSHSLAPLAADEPPEILSTFPSPSITPAPFSMPMSDFEYLPSVTVDQPEHTPTLSSTPPSSSSISSTFVPFPVRSAMNNQPESEHEAASTSMSVPLLSLPLSTLHPLSLLSSTSLPSPVTSATDDQPEPESMSVSVISTKLELSLRALPFPPDQKLDLPPRALSPPPDWLLVPPISSSTLLSLPLPEMSTLDSLPLILSPDQSSSSSRSLSQLSRPCELESSTPISAADVVTLSHPELSESSQDEFIPFLPASLEAPPIAPVSPASTSPRLPGLETVGSDSFPFEIAPPIASSVPRRGCQEPSLPHEVQSIKPPALAPCPSLFHSSGSLRRTPARFGFALALVTMAVLISTFLNISATVSTFVHKYWSKQEDIGNNRIGTLNTSSHDVFAQQLRLGQLTPRAPRLVFDPGGSVIAPDLGTRRRSQTQVEDIISSPSPRSTPASFIPVSTLDDLIVFDSGGGAFC